MFRIALCCGTGIATSTAVNRKVTAELEKRGYKGKFIISQCKVTEAVAQSKNSDLVVTTVASPMLQNGAACPVVVATGLLMNRGTEEIYNKIEAELKKSL